MGYYSQKRCICGPQDQLPDVRDEGRCFPYRTKRTCEAPVIPIPECNDTEAHVIDYPGQIPPFRISATLFDQNCDPITDQDNLPITTIIY